MSERLRRAPDGIVFDMDGLLVDSERLAWRLFRDVCNQTGFPISETLYLECVGTTGEHTRGLLQAGLGDNCPLDELFSQWGEAHKQAVANTPIPAKSGALELLQALRKRNIPLALATSTRRKQAVERLEAIGLYEFFAASICGGETNRGKPFPDPYLAAVSLLACDASHCWAFEDSNPGVRAAHDAGLWVYHVPDLVPASDEVRAFERRTELNSLTDALSQLL